MNWADQQPGESRAAWKQRMFAVHYGMGARKVFEAQFQNFNVPPEAAPTYSGRDDGYRTHGGYSFSAGESEFGRWLADGVDWDSLKVNWPNVIFADPGPEGVYVITRVKERISG